MFAIFDYVGFVPCKSSRLKASARLWMVVPMLVGAHEHSTKSSGRCHSLLHTPSESYFVYLQMSASWKPAKSIEGSHKCAMHAVEGELALLKTYSGHFRQVLEELGEHGSPA